MIQTAFFNYYDIEIFYFNIMNDYTKTIRPRPIRDYNIFQANHFCISHDFFIVIATACHLNISVSTFKMLRLSLMTSTKAA